MLALLLFAVPALSLVGIPPLSGFWAKLLVLREAFAQGRHVGRAGLLVSVLTLYSMMKIWLGRSGSAIPDAVMPDIDLAAPARRSAPAWRRRCMLAAVTLAIGTPEH